MPPRGDREDRPGDHRRLTTRRAALAGGLRGAGTRRTGSGACARRAPCRPRPPPHRGGGRCRRREVGQGRRAEHAFGDDAHARTDACRFDTRRAAAESHESRWARTPSPAWLAEAVPHERAVLLREPGRRSCGSPLSTQTFQVRLAQSAACNAPSASTARSGLTLEQRWPRGRGGSRSTPVY
ncbi:hypothetical protein ACU686_00885, partial [Yinghuangia aomiensis]